MLDSDLRHQRPKGRYYLPLNVICEDLTNVENNLLKNVTCNLMLCHLSADRLNVTVKSDMCAIHAWIYTF